MTVVVDVHLGRPEKLKPGRAAQLALLSQEERAAHDRFHFERDRDLYLCAHALTRTVLARELRVSPEALELRAERGKKPVLHAPPSELRFNLSHTPGLVVVAVCRGAEIGVDVELMEERRATREVAERCFLPEEREGIDARGASRFFELWTLKESYLKATGHGMALDPASLSFELGAGRLRFLGAPGDPPDGWSFALYDASAEHKLAVAARADALSVRFFEADAELKSTPVSLPLVAAS